MTPNSASYAIRDNQPQTWTEKRPPKNAGAKTSENIFKNKTKDLFHSHGLSTRKTLDPV
jgi:hypothetical protein